MARALNDEILRQAETLAASTEAVSDAILSAVELCRRRMGKGEPIASLKANDADSHECFRYGLAQALAEYVADADATVKAVYLCDWNGGSDEVEGDPVGLASPLSIVVWASRKTAALDALLQDYGSALTREYQELVAPAADKLRNLLDANVVDDDEVAERRGYGAIIASIHARRTKVWERAGR